MMNINNVMSLTANNDFATGELGDFDATVQFIQQCAFSWKRCEN